MGAEPGVRQLVNQVALSSGDGLDLVKDIDGLVRPRGGFVREEFNADCHTAQVTWKPATLVCLTSCKQC